MILLINGAFGIGKTTVARVLVRGMRRAVLFDPELIGIPLQRAAALAGRDIDDFQDISAWRQLTIAALRVTRVFYPNVVVPMAISNAAYLNEIRAGIRRFEPFVAHFCLTASPEVVHARLSGRRGTARDLAWQYRRATECCRLHSDAVFASHVDAEDRSPEQIAGEILQVARMQAGMTP